MGDFPFTFEELDSETNAFLMEKYVGHPSGFVRIQPGNFLTGRPFVKDCEKIYKMEIRTDDVFVLSWPKTGTTWTQEMVWTVYHDADLNAANAKDMWEKWHFLELDNILADIKAEQLSKMKEEERIRSSLLQKTIDAPSPRFIKSHLPLNMLPPDLMEKCKVIYVTRNPMDACVSWYHHALAFKNHDWVGTFPEFFRSFLNDNVCYSPYWPNVKQAWNIRNHPNMCFLFYEEMKRDLPSCIRKVGTFLGKTLTEEQVSRLENHLSFESMKNNPNTNMLSLKERGALRKDKDFIRKGIVGDWMNYLTPELKDEVEKWCKANLQDCDIEFPGVKLW